MEHDAGTPTPADNPRDIVGQMLNGAWACQAMSTATRLDVPDILQRHGSCTASELVDHGVPARVDRLQRLLRACAGLGVFTEDPAGRFGPTAVSDALTESSRDSMKSFAELYGGRWWQPWGTLFDVVADPGLLHAGGSPGGSTDMHETARFGRAMLANQRYVPALLECCDLSRVQTLVDVGGGFGHVARALARGLPEIRAVVLDLPEVVRAAETHVEHDEPEIRGRVTLTPGDMFSEVPPGDCYLLSRVLHDWDDEACTRILANCRHRLKGHGRILVIDAVVPPLGDISHSELKLLDLLMMVTLPGRERTETEWRGILASAGLRLEAIRVLDERRAMHVLEAVTG